MENTVNIDSPARKELLRGFRCHLLPIDLQTDLFSVISFPTLPYNFKMMMADIDFPEKAKKNPNGTLFMKPTMIDQNSADDIAMQCFGNGFSHEQKTSTLNPKAAQVETSESLGYNFSDIVNSLYERAHEINPNSALNEAEIPVQDIKSFNGNMSQMSTNVMSAITTYISRSLTAVTPLIEMVGDRQGISRFRKAVNTANATGEDNITSWLKSQSSVLKDIGRHDKDVEYQKLERKHDVAETASHILSCIAISEIPSGLDKTKYMSAVSTALFDATSENVLNSFIRKHISGIRDKKEFDRMWNNDQHNQQPWALTLKKITLEEALDNDKFIYSLFESDDDDDNDASGVSLEKIDYQKMQHDLFTLLSDSMSDIIGPRAEWTCVKELANQMKILKDRADEEIKKKIELVCKTGGQKSMVHHPFKAEGLLSMWSRYSMELQKRIDNRIAQVIGSNGSVESGSAAMVEDFLRVTYPQILSVMLVYRCIFAQIAIMYKNGFIPEYTLDEEVKNIALMEEDLDRGIDGVLATYDTQTI